MKISIESTKAETIIKFVAEDILTNGSFEYNNIEDANNSNLIQQLFHLPFVKKVYVTSNFIAVERYNIVEWIDVQEELKQVIENYLSTYGSVFNSDEQKIMPIQLYTESTPNPNVMKFVTSKLLSSQNIEILSKDNTQEIPIATELFKFEFIKEVFISENYISITKTESSDWLTINNKIRTFIKNYLEKGKPIITDKFTPAKNDEFKVESSNYENLDEASKEIIAILDEYIKPAVTSDGGNILFQSYDVDNKTVKVLLQGACSGCPSSTITLKNGIEATLKQLLPNKINEVIAING
jgi:Fe-S cluster biogenesis protein NfuA